MRLALLTTSLLVLAAASPALAQTPVQRGETYVSAPWWMRAPVIASTGLVQVDLTANRAYVSAGFRSVDRSVAEASRAARSPRPARRSITPSARRSAASMASPPRSSRASP